MAHLPTVLARPLAHARALAGDPEGAGAALTALDDLGIPDTAVCGALVIESRGWVAIAAANQGIGRGLLIDAADLAADRGGLTREASALHSLAEPATSPLPSGWPQSRPWSKGSWSRPASVTPERWPTTMSVAWWRSRAAARRPRPALPGAMTPALMRIETRRLQRAPGPIAYGG